MGIGVERGGGRGNRRKRMGGKISNFVLICLVEGLVLLLSRPFCRGGPRCRSPPPAPPPEPGHAVRLVRVIITTRPMPFTAIYHRERCPWDPNRSLITLLPLSPQNMSAPATL